MKSLDQQFNLSNQRRDGRLLLSQSRPQVVFAELSAHPVPLGQHDLAQLFCWFQGLQGLIKGAELLVERCFRFLVFCPRQLTLKSRDFMPHFFPFFFVLSFHLLQLPELFCLFADCLASFPDIPAEGLLMSATAFRPLLWLIICEASEVEI